MFVVWGTRNAGKVDQRDGQYAITRFAHVYWLPLFPTSSFWVTAEGVGHEIKLSGKSVFAGYARSWGLVLAAAGLIGWGGVAAFAASILGVAAAALSWTWKDVTTETAKRRSDWNYYSFGTRCEPKLLPSEIRDPLTLECKERWATLAEGQSPSDVARFGTDDPDRAAAAYAVLRLTAVTLPPEQAREADADAMRIAEDVRDELQLGDGGPYRSNAVEHQLAPSDPEAT